MLQLIQGQGKERYKRLFDIHGALVDHLYEHHEVAEMIIFSDYIPHDLPLAVRDHLRTLHEIREAYNEGRPARPILKAIQGGKSA